MGSGCRDDVQDVVPYGSADIDVPHRGLDRDDIVGLQYRVDGIYRVAGVAFNVQNLDFVVTPRVADRDSCREAVELRFGQRIGAGKLDVVLSCDHEERRWKTPSYAIDCDLSLLHAL